MIEEMTHRLVKLVRGALLPTTLPQTDLNLYGGWENKTELTGAWLTQIIHTVRFSLCVWTFVSLIMCSSDITPCLPYHLMASLSPLPLLSLIQGLPWCSVCPGDPQRFAAGDPGSATGDESSLPHGDSAAHCRRWERTLWNKIQMTLNLHHTPLKHMTTTEFLCQWYFYYPLSTGFWYFRYSIFYF